MSLPVKLPPNTISIYGYTGYPSIYGIVPPKQGYQFGVVNQMYYGAQENLVGQSVLFKIADSTQVRYLGTPYFLIQQEEIILTENEL